MQLVISDDKPYVTGMDSPLKLSPGKMRWAFRILLLSNLTAYNNSRECLLNPFDCVSMIMHYIFPSSFSTFSGLGMRPRTNFKTALIRYAASDPQTYMPYVQNIRTFVYLYEEVNIKPQDGFATCEKTKTPDDVDLVCKFYPIDMGVCVKENNYGYDRSQPCVVLKINKVRNLVHCKFLLECNHQNKRSTCWAVEE